MRQRLAQFDVLKGIGILLVLLGHTDITGIPKNCIYGFHMPLFFFCSGCFYRQKDWGDFLKDNVRSLLIPYLFFVLVLHSTYFMLDVKASGIDKAITSLGGNLNILNENSHLYLTIWFLICLFEIRLIYEIVNRYVHSDKLKSVIYGVFDW